MENITTETQDVLKKQTELKKEVKKKGISVDLVSTLKSTCMISHYRTIDPANYSYLRGLAFKDWKTLRNYNYDGMYRVKQAYGNIKNRSKIQFQLENDRVTSQKRNSIEHTIYAINVVFGDDRDFVSTLYYAGMNVDQLLRLYEDLVRLQRMIRLGDTSSERYITLLYDTTVQVEAIVNAIYTKYHVNMPSLILGKIHELLFYQPEVFVKAEAQAARMIKDRQFKLEMKKRGII